MDGEKGVSLVVDKEGDPDGRKKGQKGRGLSPKSREKLAAARRAEWSNPAMRDKRLAGMRSPTARAKQRASWNSRPTGQERRVITILDDLGLAYEYEPRLGRLRPDFVVAGALIVEMFGCYWHACEACGFEDTHGYREKDAARLATLRTHHPVLIVWEHSLDDPKAVKARILDEIRSLRE